MLIKNFIRVRSSKFVKIVVASHLIKKRYARRLTDASARQDEVGQNTVDLLKTFDQ